MAIKVLRTHVRTAVRVRIVAPAEYARVREIMREEVAQPVDAVVRRPCLLAVSVQAVHSDNAVIELVSAKAFSRGSALDDRSYAL
jgi:hypothetical protein